MEKTSVLTLIEVKKINQKRVYEFLYRQKTASKLEIANAINVSLPTVASSLNTLIAQGLVSNCGVYDSTGGRKAQIFCCNALARIAVGVELLKERVEIVAVDLYGNTLAEDFLELEFENEASYYSKLGEWINQFVKALPYMGEQNLGVCISLQGGLSRVLILGMMGILPSCVVALWFSRFKVDSSGRTIAMIDDVPSMPEGETEPLRY